MQAADILKLTKAGLHCEVGDFFVDPVRKVDRAVITHGHADHARAGHNTVLATKETLAVMAVRYGANFAQSQQVARYGETVQIGDALVTFKPAGHVLGSAQIVIDVKGKRVVVSGDYKRAADPTCSPFEPTNCDIFITEATFGLPIFRHPNAAIEVGRLLQSLVLFPDRPHFVGAYSLGKAQRLAALLRKAGYHDPLFVDPATESLCALYENHGVPLGEFSSIKNQTAATINGKIVIGPPSAREKLIPIDANNAITSFASGWMRVRKRAHQSNIDLPLIISDHADWSELTATIKEIEPGELWVTHGEEQALIHWATTLGMKARPLAIKGYGIEDTPSQ